jgi:hypothetical protein
MITMSMNAEYLIVNFAVGIFIPLLVQVVVAKLANAEVKALILLALSAAASVLTPLLSASTFDWRVIALSFAQLYGTAIVTHYGLYKPTGITGADGLIANVIPGGIGAPAGRHRG